MYQKYIIQYFYNINILYIIKITDDNYTNEASQEQMILPPGT